MHEPFADFVGVTVPKVHGAELLADVVPEFESLGMSLEVSQDRLKLWRSPEASGTVQAKEAHGVLALGISGAVCAGLRSARRFESMLAAIATYPHRVTRLDAALDVKEDAAPIVERVAAAGRRGELSLTRKSISPAAIDTHLNLRSDGVLSGTVYCGTPKAEARMVVYDKRLERLSRKLLDVGDLTRYELRLRSGTRVTLRDCASPAPVFFHHASPCFLPKPDDVCEWEPAAEGFVLERAEVPLPAARMIALAERSPDVRRLLQLAQEVGPYGFDLLVSTLRKLGA